MEDPNGGILKTGVAQRTYFGKLPIFWLWKCQYKRTDFGISLRSVETRHWIQQSNKVYLKGCQEV